ncbi:LeuA family protein [Patescibacteria group bacterium]
MPQKKQIFLNDVALRESAQVEKGAMSPRDQETYVRYLCDGGIDRIEVGYPSSSPEELKKCQNLIEIARSYPNPPLVSCLAPAREADIDVVKSVNPDICHIYIQASDKFIQAMYPGVEFGGSDAAKRQWVISQTASAIAYAKSLGFGHIEFSPEDAARSSKAYVAKLVAAAIDAGATIVNIPDTTGLRVLDEFGKLIRYVYRNVPNIAKAEVSCHCHNDSDHSTTDALQAIMAGATVIEGCFYGLGERSGMTKFESVIMAVNTRRDVFGDYEIKFNSHDCVKIVNFLGHALGMPVPRHWTVVGEQNAVCSSGTHQAVQAKISSAEQGYYSWKPERYGHGGVSTLFTSMSGKRGLREIAEKLGFNPSKQNLATIFERAKRLADAKAGGAIEAHEIEAMIKEVTAEIPFPITIVRCQAIGGEGTIPTATIIAEVDGQQVTKSGTGNGPYDAIMHAVRKAVRHFSPELHDIEITLNSWRPTPVTSGAESLADVYASIRFRHNGDPDGVYAGNAVRADTNQASAQAFANCFSWYLAAREARAASEARDPSESAEARTSIM